MDIEEFIKDVLGQITRSVNLNESGGEIKYTVDHTKGVDFDLAVTTGVSAAAHKGIKGGLRARVVGAEATKSSTKVSSSAIASRVQFNVNLRRDNGPLMRVGKR